MARIKSTPGTGPPVLVGFFEGQSGIALSAQLASRALHHLGLEHRCIDVSDFRNVSPPPDNSAAAWIFYLNPPELMHLLFRWDPRRLEGPRYGFWSWELPMAPAAWVRAVAVMDGVCAPSRFSAEAFVGAKHEVTAIPHPLVATDYAQFACAAEQLSKDSFCVVSLFDFKSSLERKNPFAALEAFKLAFGDDTSARMIFKTQNAACAPDLVALLRERAGPNVQVIDAVWPRNQVMELIASADALISLHRAEGFGLPLAESMMLETPVVATNWSGNLDFMDDQTACLVPGALIDVADAQDIYRGQVWANPDVAAAAAYLRRLHDDEVFARTLADRARAKVTAELSPASWLNTFPSALSAALRDGGERNSAA